MTPVTHAESSPTIPVGRKESQERKIKLTTAETIYQEEVHPRRSEEINHARSSPWSEKKYDYSVNHPTPTPTKRKDTHHAAKHVSPSQRYSESNTIPRKNLRWDEWQKAIEVELQNPPIITFDVSDARPERTLGTKYVFKVKHDDLAK